MTAATAPCSVEFDHCGEFRATVSRRGRARALGRRHDRGVAQRRKRTRVAKAVDERKWGAS